MNQKKTKNGFAGLYAVFLVAAIILAFVAFGAGYWLSNREVAISNGDDQLVDETNQDDSTEASEPEIVSPQGVLQINWYTEPEEVEPLDVVKALEPDGANDDVKTYVLGTIASGEYNGMMLTVNIVPYIGMGETNRSFYLITSENESQKPVLLDRYAIDGASFFQAWSGFYSFIER
ncbi:hypothetical protein KKH24_01345, partial [Patescibacteria group bacterium]|nr:hypothetical protein [Patescibacteria group bacterium]